MFYIEIVNFIVNYLKMFKGHCYVHIYPYKVHLPVHKVHITRTNSIEKGKTFTILCLHNAIYFERIVSKDLFVCLFQVKLSNGV